MKTGVARHGLLAMWIALGLGVALVVTPGSAVAATFGYLFNCSGELLKLDLGTLQVAGVGPLANAAGAAALIPPGRLSGCLFDSVRYDGSRGRVYGAIPTDRRKYVVVAIELPRIAVVGAVAVAPPLGEPPTLLVSPDGSRLFVKYRDEIAEEAMVPPSIVTVVEIYDTTTLTKLDTLREVTDDEAYLAARIVINSRFSRDAYFRADGQTIYDGLSRTRLSGTNMVREQVGVVQTLTPAQRSQLRPFEDADPMTGQSWFRFGVVDSTAGRALLIVNNSARTRTAFFTVDLETQQPSPIIDGPLSRARLTPDGRRMVREDIEVRGPRSIAGSGHFVIYDTLSGTQLSEFRRPEVGGSISDIVCIAPSGESLLYVAGAALYVVSLTTDTPATRINTPFYAHQGMACLFSDR